MKTAMNETNSLPKHIARVAATWSDRDALVEMGPGCGWVTSQTCISGAADVPAPICFTNGVEQAAYVLNHRHAKVARH